MAIMAIVAIVAFVCGALVGGAASVLVILAYGMLHAWRSLPRVADPIPARAADGSGPLRLAHARARARRRPAHTPRATSGAVWPMPISSVVAYPKLTHADFSSLFKSQDLLEIL